MIPPKALALLVALSAWTAHARADFLPGLIPDRYNNFVSGAVNTGGYSSVGQSFTPDLNKMEWAALAVMGGYEDFTLAVQVYQGEGFSGPLLATSRSVSLPKTYGALGLGAWVYFDFDQPIPLVAGSQYTLKVQQLAGNTFVDYAAAGSIGGAGILNGQPIRPNFTLTFGEGIFDPAAVPEPSSLLLCGVAALGGASLAALRRRPLA